MNVSMIFAIAASAASMLVLPALAEDTSSSMMSDESMMAEDHMMSDGMMMTTTRGGEVVAIMPNGAMGTMMMEGDKMNMTIGMSAALDHCVMFITAADGKVYQVDTSSKQAQDECEAIAK